jgi:hypothetical protein
MNTPTPTIAVTIYVSVDDIELLDYWPSIIRPFYTIRLSTPTQYVAIDAEQIAALLLAGGASGAAA